VGIDYVLDIGCPPKKNLGGIERLVALVKARSRADAVIDLVRKQGDQRPPAEIEFTVVVRTADGTTEQAVSAQSLLDEAAPLEPERATCADCPADGGAGGFGCYRSIPYPIPEVAEAWLLARLPPEIECTAGYFLTRAVEDFAWSGEHAATMRKRGDTFFESRMPLGMRWGAFELSSDQVFHMMFHVGALEPTHCLMLALFFGVVPHDIDPDILRDPARRRLALAESKVNVPNDPRCVPIAQFVAALGVAAYNDVGVLIDG
jgi:hypothetical protein